MKIKDIKDIETNETRTDSRYPSRIGSTVEFLFEPTVGGVFVYSYTADNHGNRKYGILRTSTINDIVENDSEFVITTRNSIYYFSK